MGQNEKIDIVKNSLLEAKQGLDNLILSSKTLELIVKASEFMIDSIKAGGKIISCGNGGSCCDAMHFAEELSGRYRLDRDPIPAISISDPSYLTCVSNDYGYSKVFSRYVQGFCKPSDTLLGISTSGSSENVVEAVKVASSMGVKTVCLTGKPGSNLEQLSDICIITPCGKFADRVQELHIKIIHILIDLIEQGLK